MPITGDKYPFTDDNISKSPQKNGVYALYDNDITIYIGRASGDNTIRLRLQAHKRGDEGKCTQGASDYKREITSTPITREGELLEEYKKAHGKLPRCNEVMP
jgi:hypothetical protein